MSSFVGSNSKDHSDESYMWIAANDGVETMYFPMAVSKIRYDGNGALGYCQLNQGTYCLDENGNSIGSGSKFHFQNAEIIEYTDLP